MNRLGVLFHDRAKHMLNPGVVYLADEEQIAFLCRLVPCNKPRVSNIHLIKTDLDHRITYMSQEPLINGDCHEDPRVSLLDVPDCRKQIAVTLTEVCYIDERCYTNILIGMGPEFDLLSFYKPQMSHFEQNKNGILFQANGYYYLLHRPKPSINLARSSDLCYFQELGVIISPISCSAQCDYVGGGAPPIDFGEGLLLFYHGVKQGVYSLFAALLDKNDPSKVLARTLDPIATPQEEYERCGWVPNVIFATGAFMLNDIVRVYYGAADSCVAALELSKNEILQRLFSAKIQYV